MGATTNATTVHYGTTWDDATLLEWTQCNTTPPLQDACRPDWEGLAVFSIHRDLAYPAFCQACLAGKPLDSMSTDERYCQKCHDFLEGNATETVREQSQPGAVEACGKTTLRSGPAEIMPRSYMPLALSRGHRGKGGRPRKALPLDLIEELGQEGYSIRAIAGRLAAGGIAVSPRTIGRILKGA